MKTKITPDPTILRKGLLFWCLSSPPFYHTDICVYIKCIVCVCKHIQTQVHPLAAAAAAAKSLQSCPTLCDSIDGSPLGSSVPGILQARILEWVALKPSTTQGPTSSRARHTTQILQQHKTIALSFNIQAAQSHTKV